MAKFFPFIVEKSTPTYIFNAIITRSKGLNNVTVASVFYLIVSQGIASVRETTNRLPDMPLPDIYNELLSSYPFCVISTADFLRYTKLAPYIKPLYSGHIPLELKDYCAEDALTFLMVMQLCGKLSEYTDIPFHKLTNGDAEILENNLSSSNLFSSSAPPLVFSGFEDLQAYVNYHTVISPDEKPEPVCALLRPDNAEKEAPDPDPRGKPEYDTKQKQDWRP